MHTIASPLRAGAPRRSKRLLAFASDARLVDQMRAGNEAAFEVAYERYGSGILAFCRHMLASQEEAEDALQQAFASAYRDLARGGERELRLKPWLYTIARNRCLSMLRARRDELHLEGEPATAGLAEQVERRAELRDLLCDLGDLPAEQRAALLLTELADLSHAEIGEVLDCEAGRVKALVYRARSSLIERREARDTPCHEIREQLAALSGGSLRRSAIRYHLRSCSGCSAYRDQVKRQRQLLAAALPVVPPALLKAKVVGGAGAAGGLGGAAGGLGGVATGASITGAAGPMGSGVVAKAAILTVLAGGGAVATEATIDHHGALKGPSPAGHQASSHRDPSGPFSQARPSSRRTGGSASQRVRRTPESATGQSAAHSHRNVQPTGAPEARGKQSARAPAQVPRSGGQGAEQPASQADGVPQAVGPVSAPPTTAPLEQGPQADERPRDPAAPPKTDKHDSRDQAPATGDHAGRHRDEHGGGHADKHGGGHADKHGGGHADKHGGGHADKHAGTADEG